MTGDHYNHCRHMGSKRRERDTIHEEETNDMEITKNGY